MKTHNHNCELTYFHQVSSSSIYTRTPRECEIRWLSDQHPEFNHGPWTQDEITKLKDLVAEYGNEQVDWEAVADKLGVRLLFTPTEKNDDLHIIDKPNSARMYESRHDAKDSYLVPGF